MFEQVYWFWSYFRRCRYEPSVIESRIEAEGGTVIETRQLGAIRPSPFDGLRPYPIHWESRVRYGNRRGSWLVRTSRGSDCFDWVWADYFGETSLPIKREGAIVDNEVTTVGYAFEAIVVSGIILVSICAILAVWWFCF